MWSPEEQSNDLLSPRATVELPTLIKERRALGSNHWCTLQVLPLHYSHRGVAGRILASRLNNFDPSPGSAVYSNNFYIFRWFLKVHLFNVCFRINNVIGEMQAVVCQFSR